MRTVKYNRWRTVRWTTSTFCISSQKGKFRKWWVTARTTEEGEGRGGIQFRRVMLDCITPRRSRLTRPSLSSVFLNLELIDYFILCTVIGYKVLLGGNFIFLKSSKHERTLIMFVQLIIAYSTTARVGLRVPALPVSVGPDPTDSGSKQLGAPIVCQRGHLENCTPPYVRVISSRTSANSRLAHKWGQWPCSSRCHTL